MFQGVLLSFFLQTSNIKWIQLNNNFSLNRKKTYFVTCWFAINSYFTEFYLLTLIYFLKSEWWIAIFYFYILSKYKIKFALLLKIIFTFIFFKLLVSKKLQKIDFLCKITEKLWVTDLVTETLFEILLFARTYSIYFYIIIFLLQNSF